jgi:hypothetical protein
MPTRSKEYTSEINRHARSAIAAKPYCGGAACPFAFADAFSELLQPSSINGAITGLRLRRIERNCRSVFIVSPRLIRGVRGSRGRAEENLYSCSWDRLDG